MEGHAGILLQIFVMFAAAKTLGLLAERVRIPGVIAEILAGILIGQEVLKWVAVEDWTMALATLGAIILLFDVGLSQKLTTLMRVGKIALPVAVLGVVLPFFLGFGLLQLTAYSQTYSQTEAIFLGAAMVATSVGITARVLQDLGALRTVAATIILGAAVIDDILGMIVLAIVHSLSEGGIDYVKIGSVTALAVGFTVFIVLVGRRVVRRLAPRVARFAASNPYFALALVICLGLSVAAERIGMAAIIGAFLAGLVFSEEEMGPMLKEKMHSVYEFLVPFFFVTMGMQMKLSVFAQSEILVLAALATLLAILGKLVGCGLGAQRLGWRGAVQVGVGMVPRGEVGIIIASIGLGLGTVSDSLYAVVIVMTLVTTLLAPPVLKILFGQRAPAAAVAADPPGGAAAEQREQ
ncbi:MAG: cation:proton antiporter [Terriglobia bacterium]